MNKIKNAVEKIKLVSPGTWVRLVLLVASLVNMSLKVFGIDFFSENSECVEKAVSIIIMSVTALAAYWKNNSFTEAALAADEVYKSMKKQS